MLLEEAKKQVWKIYPEAYALKTFSYEGEHYRITKTKNPFDVSFISKDKEEEQAWIKSALKIEQDSILI